MFGEEDWDAEFSSPAVTISHSNNDQPSYSPKTFDNNDTSQRTFIGRGRGKFSSPDSGFGNNKSRGVGGKCFKCGKEGHISNNCPNNNQTNGFIRNDQGGSGNFKPRSSKCFKCGEEGHISRDCTNEGNSNGNQGGYNSYKPRNSKCYKCGEEGHISRDCTGGSSNGDQGFGGTYKARSNKCYKCGEEGHISRDCPGGATNGFSNGDSGGFGSTRSRSNKCYKCNEEGHISRDCPNNNSTGGGGFGYKSDSKSYGRSSSPGRWSEKKSYGDRSPGRWGEKKSYGDRSPGRWGEKKSYGDHSPGRWGEKKSYGDHSPGKWGEKKNFGDNKGFDSSKPRSNNCYKCGEEGHISRDCPKGDGNDRKKGCFNCGDEDHISRNCPNADASGNSGGFGRRNGDSGGNDGVTREKYIPPPPPEEEDEMFNTLQRGINFNKYDSIPVEVSGENCPRHINTFQEAHLTETIAKNVARAKYEKPTPVQKYSIPIVNAGRDLMACAQTGSGKTAAFLLPALTAMIRSGLKSTSFSDKQSPQAIIVGPTRELVNQIFLEARKFARGSICRACVAYGGTSVGYQLGEIQRGCNILIATPGRLMDFINKGRIGLEHVQFLILDEADRMLDMGFEEEIRKLSSTPGMPSKNDRQTLMFSATFPDEIQKLAHDFLKEDFIFLTVGRVGGACSDVTQTILQVDQNDKREKLQELLADVSQTRARTLVFVETKRSADFLACSLSQSGYPTTSIHGDRLQREREEALRDFKRGEYPILIATSVAARGLDIPKVEHVINYDIPKDIDEYVHRIGRTGRCGNLGKATSFYDNSKDSEVARCLIRVLSDSMQDVPSWLEGCAEGAIGTNFGTDRSGFGGRDARNKRGGGRSGGGRARGDYDYNDGGGFGTTSSFGGNTGGGDGGFGGGNGFGDDESWD